MKSTMASGAFLVLVAVLGVGCLPSGSRGESSRAAASNDAASAAAGTPAPSGPTPRPSFVPPTPTPAPTFHVYIVASGDSLDSIAHRFGTTGRSIAFWNRATYPSLDPESAKYRPNLLKVGWTLLLIPNAVVDEQDLPDPSEAAAESPSASTAP
jgi:hypothetical protein